jgi:thiol-disulfide isomerase/thioredoxin
LVALCLANAKIGNLAIAKQSLFSLFDGYPIAEETAFAFSIYNYEYYKASGKQIEKDVRASVKKIFINYPKAAICKDANVFEYLRNDPEISTLAFEKVIKPQFATGQISYYALGNLPELYIERKEQLDSAKKMLILSIERFQTGEIQHQYLLNNGHYQMYVPFLLFDIAKINSLQGDQQSAITNTSAAMQILTGSNVEGNFLPLMLSLRAAAYTKLGNFNLALEDYKKLYLNGNTGVLDSMQRLFPLCDVKQATFATFVAFLKSKSGVKNEKQNLLSNFVGTDLKGNQVSLNDLKGKIVVLNVWGIGCGPCIAEMPVLNELVKMYKDNNNVKFIAVTADQKKDLLAFFKHRTFDYRVLSNVAHITETFNTNALPVHMVIGKSGEIINRSIGSREDIKSYLKGIIDANL